MEPTIPMKRIDDLMKEQREANAVSMASILDVVESEGFDREACKQYMLGTYFGIHNEEAYINKSIRQARKQKMIAALFDTSVEETIKDVSVDTKH